MSQVETVALWTGLIASIAGIVLSIVATVFAVWVSKEAAEVNQQMIRSLQKIESTVEHLSADTRELITAGWNKMLSGLGNSETEADNESPNMAEEISSGITTEVRSELTEASNEAPPGAERIARIERALEDLQETLLAQLNRGRRSHSRTQVDALTAVVRELPLEARALLTVLSSGRHLNRKEYRSAAQTASLRAAIKALRSAGILVPLEGLENGQPVPVYHIQPDLVYNLKLASRLVGDVPRDTLAEVLSALSNIGYEPRRP